MKTTKFCSFLIRQQFVNVLRWKIVRANSEEEAANRPTEQKNTQQDENDKRTEKEEEESKWITRMVQQRW